MSNEAIKPYQEVPEVRLGDFITAMPVGQHDRGTDVIRLVKGVVIWDYGNGTIQVTNQQDTYVCEKATHPCIWPLDRLRPEERVFVERMRRELIANAEGILAHATTLRPV